MTMIKNAFTEVFENKSYLFLAGAAALAVFAFAVWLPNMRLLFSLATDSAVPISAKFSFPIRLLQAITTNFTVLSASYTIAIALLAGINAALIAYCVKRQKQRLSKAGVTAGTFGILSGVLGMGCAACGSLILASVLGTAGGAGIIALLPFKGGEFGALGVILLASSIFSVARRIAAPPVCLPQVTE